MVGDKIFCHQLCFNGKCIMHICTSAVLYIIHFPLKHGWWQKILSKIFIGWNRPLGHADQLYTYKGHILSVGLTEKRQKTTKIAILSPNKA